jgi:hypothetical protein
MAKTMFQISGAADSGTITAVLKKPSGENADLSLDAPVELSEAGEHLLSLSVPGFVPINITLDVTPGGAAPGVKAKDNYLPLGCLLIRQRFKEVVASTQSDWLFLLRCDFTHPRELVLVAGIESGRAGTDFDLFAHTRRKDQTSETHKSIEPAADANTIVTHFSFATGKRSSYMLRSPSRWMVVDEEEHGRPAPREQKPEGLSITHAYDWIIDAGKALPGRVVELSIFGHAWKQGPILLGTDDILRDKIKRDPNDHDCRIKDFNGSVMDVNAFAKAFSAEAQNHVFGCYGNLLYKWCARVLQHPRPSDPNKKFVVRKKNGSRAKMTWDACHAVVDKALVKNYSYALAVATGCPTWAGTPGAGSSFARKGRRHYCEMDMRAFGIYVEAVAKTFELEHDAQWYVKYVPRLAEAQVAPSNDSAGTAAKATTPKETPQQANAEKKEEGVEIVEPTADRKQYVNLPKGTHQGRLVQVKAKLTPPTQGTDVHWSFEGRSHLPQKLSMGKAGFGSINSPTETAVTKTDSSGVASVDFYVSQQGGDQFQVIASRSATAQGSSSKTITAWRKIYYEMDTMKGKDGTPARILDQHTKLHPWFRKVFVELKHEGKDQHPPHRLNFPPSGSLQGELSNFGYDYFAGNKAPYQAHLVAIEHCAKKDTVEVVEFELKSYFGTLPTKYKLYVYDGEEPEKWLTYAKYCYPKGPKDKYGRLDWKELDKSLVEINTGSDGKARASVFLSAKSGLTASPENPLRLKFTLRLAKERVAFQITKSPNTFFCDGFLRGLWDQKLYEHNKIAIIVHEIAHVLGMVPADADSFADTSTGPHCELKSCVMNRAVSSHTRLGFCESCTKAILKLDFNSNMGAFKYRGKGPKS